MLTNRTGGGGGGGRRRSATPSLLVCKEEVSDEGTKKGEGDGGEESREVQMQRLQ